MTSFLDVVTGVTYYLIALPSLKIYQWIVLGLSPLLHLVSHVLHAASIPLALVTKLETLYIFLGVGALIGICTGSVLSVIWTIALAVLGLDTDTPTARSMKQVPTKRISPPINRQPSPPVKQGPVEGLLPTKAPAIDTWKNEFDNLLGHKSIGRASGAIDQKSSESVDRRGRRASVLGQTILEEEDGESEEGQLIA